MFVRGRWSAESLGMEMVWMERSSGRTVRRTVLARWDGFVYSEWSLSRRQLRPRQEVKEGTTRKGNRMKGSR